MKAITIPFPGVKRGTFRFEGEHLVDGVRLLEFSHSSYSRDQIYLLTLNVDTLEVSCDCEDFRCRAAAWESFLLYSPQEELNGYDSTTATRKVGVMITRHPKGLCKHARKIQGWVRRRGLQLALEGARSEEEAKLIMEIISVSGNVVY